MSRKRGLLQGHLLDMTSHKGYVFASAVRGPDEGMDALKELVTARIRYWLGYNTGAGAMCRHYAADEGVWQRALGDLLVIKNMPISNRISLKHWARHAWAALWNLCGLLPERYEDERFLLSRFMDLLGNELGRDGDGLVGSLDFVRERIEKIQCRHCEEMAGE